LICEEAEWGKIFGGRMKLVFVIIASCLFGQADSVPTDSVTPVATPAVSSSAESILKTLLAANVTNTTQYPRGEMAVRLRTETGLAAKYKVCDMLVRWSGQNMACDFIRAELFKLEAEPGWKGAPTLKSPGLTRMVTVGGAKTAFYRLSGATGPGSNPQFLLFKAGRESMDVRDFQMRPDQAWFNIERKHQLRFLLESILAQGKTKNSLVHVDGTRVILGGLDAKEQKRASIEFSLNHGGNAVKQENWGANSNRSEFGSRSHWSWAQLPDKRWYLTSMDAETWTDDLAHPKAKEIYERNRKKRPAAYDPNWETKPSWQMRLDVHDFNPDPKWDVDPFDTSLWRVATGTLVEDRTETAPKRYKFGQDTADPTAEIDALAERLKGRKK
jgi:hypothetical protein